METILYISVKTVSVVFILYKVWNMIFSKRIENFWDMLHNWARIARIRLWKYRKKRMAEKARRARRKAIMQKPLLPKEQSVDKTSQQAPLSTSEITAMLEKVSQRFEDDHEDKPLQLPVEEKPKPKIKPVVFDDPNEVMGKSNIIYYEDPEVARKTPTRSIELKQVELPVDEDVNPEDVEDNFVPQKRLSQEDMKELMSSESIPDPEFSGACTFEELGNVADVLLNRTTDKEKIMDAAETLYKLQDSDIYHFYTTSISTEKQVDRLLRDNLDGAGRRLNGKQLERTEIDWNKFM
ncbi:DUF4122 family protein [Barnesiella intestinihominis]|uniref:DUF4122 family protein n=1 Tax=Barnesiella intestinihominis TaxID=487174 RepID=UPI001899E46F|nr:DUF4122 family protein [Barnesiella intestinihominis]MDB0674539.1 DUF4122 family protein [Barnesiella intestinihominis]